MVLDDRRQLPAVFFVWKSIDDSSEDGKDAAECERRWPVLGGWNCAKFPLSLSDCVKLLYDTNCANAKPLMRNSEFAFQVTGLAMKEASEANLLLILTMPSFTVHVKEYGSVKTRLTPFTCSLNTAELMLLFVVVVKASVNPTKYRLSGNLYAYAPPAVWLMTFDATMTDGFKNCKSDEYSIFCRLTTVRFVPSIPYTSWFSVNPIE